MEAEIRRLMELFVISCDEAFVMLKQAKWNRSKLEGDYVDDPDRTRLRLGVSSGECAERNLMDAFANSAFQLVKHHPIRAYRWHRYVADPDPPVAPTSPTIFCNVTYQDVPVSSADACACGHWFSQEAWKGHIEAAITTEPKSALTLKCMEAGCSEIVRPRMFQKYLSPALYQKYRLYQVRSFVEEDKRIVWCPAPGCTYSVMDLSGVAQDVECLHGHRFCFLCLASAHRPASCSDVKMWLLREQDEGENAKWLLAHTKPCPKCKRSIEKNQGCNHMSCRPEVGGCGHHFCWVCLQDWESHRDYYNCNRRPAEGLYSDEASKSAKAELQRYTFYYERYRNQLQSADFAKQSMLELEAMQSKLLSAFPVTLSQLECMKAATDVIVRGRRIAAWAYVHGYYIPASNTVYRTLFEDSQALLEKHLEQLHELLEPATINKLLSDCKHSFSAAEEKFWLWMRQTINLQSSTNQFLSKLVDAVDAGFVVGAGKPDTAHDCYSPSKAKRARTSEPVA